MKTCMCRAKLTSISLVGADSDHVMDALGKEGYPCMLDGYQLAMLAFCATRRVKKMFMPNLLHEIGLYNIKWLRTL